MLKLLEILPHKTPFVRVHIKHYRHFRRATNKQYHTHFFEFISHNTFSGSYYKIRLNIFSEFIPTNINTTRVATKQYCKIILFCKVLSNKTDIFRASLPNTRAFPQKMYQTILLPLSYKNLF